MKTVSRLALMLVSYVLIISGTAAQSRSNTGSDPVLSGMLPGKHRGAVTAITRDNSGRILSAGEDGFLQIWNSRSAERRFQLSPYAIRSMVLRPGKTQIAVIENDGLGLYRISAWDYEQKKNIFTKEFNDSVSFINYSASGNFLIAAREERRETIFINSDTGLQMTMPWNFSGAIAFAATGRSERNMICYFSEGVLSYWDLENQLETQRINIPSDIQGAVLFGNNRFLGGFDPYGLIILDAVTGAILTRNSTIRQGHIFNDNPDIFEDPSMQPTRSGAARFSCIGATGNSFTIHQMEINLLGSLVTINRRVVPSAAAAITSGITHEGGSFIVGNRDGSLWFLGRTSARVLDTGNPEMIVDASTTSSAIGFITGKGAFSYIPLDYNLLNQSFSLSLENISIPDNQTSTGQSGFVRPDGLPGVTYSAEPVQAGSYTNISSDPLEGGGGGISGGMGSTFGSGSLTGGMYANGINAAESHFVLWQPGASRSTPLLKTISLNSGNFGKKELSLEKLPMRFPMRTASVMGNKILFLDTFGNVFILDRESGDLRFTYTASGSVDAAFIDENTIILSRTAVSGNVPFMTVNTITGETVSLPYSALMGLKVYKGSSGAIYAATASNIFGNVQTEIIRLDLSSPAQSRKLAVYNGEDTSFSIAESGSNLASTLGGGGAELYLNRQNYGNQATETVSMERSPGLPQKIIEGSRWFIILDSEGSISWHDNRSGKLLATFTMYQDTWILEKTDQFSMSREIIQGRIRKI